MFRSSVTLSVLLASPAALLAADTKEPNILAVQFDLAIWTIVIFVLLLSVLRKYAWGPMLQGLHHREESIHKAVTEAQNARAETERLRAETQKQIEEAFAKIPGMMDEARRDGEKLVEEMKNKALAEINAEHSRRKREIETATNQALQELWNQSAQLATLISAKAIGKSLGQEDHHRLIDEALAEVRSPGK